MLGFGINQYYVEMSAKEGDGYIGFYVTKGRKRLGGVVDQLTMSETHKLGYYFATEMTDGALKLDEMLE